MNFNTFKTSLLTLGWTVEDTQNGYTFTDPGGKVYQYKGLQAVRYGTWLDVDRCIEVPLPVL